MIYNELRPMDLSEVEGQDIIVETLKSQLKNNQISHSYLNIGTRGTGKTSIARILARAVNCLNPTEHGPCNCCENCKQLLKGNNMDVLEIDAATNNGVDDVRQLRSFFETVPLMKMKVLIIDEMHMLSNAAMNALLKVLEEPPSNLIFIGCTTELHKVLPTIVSRCMKLFFKSIDEVTISTKLSSACEKYNKEYELSALYQIAKAADGSMRDALSLLESCFYSDKITMDVVRENLGTVHEEIIMQLVDGLVSNNGQDVFSNVTEVADTGRSMSLMINDIIAVLTDIVCYHQAGKESITNNAWYLESLSSIANKTTLDDMFMAISQLSDLKRDIKKESNPKILIITVLFKIMRDMNKKEELRILQEKVNELEQKILSMKNSVFVESNVKSDSNDTHESISTNELADTTSEEEKSSSNEHDFVSVSNEVPFDMDEDYSDEEEEEICDEEPLTFNEMKEQEKNADQSEQKKESASTPSKRGMFERLYGRR